jgi:hypothetical protein
MLRLLTIVFLIASVFVGVGCSGGSAVAGGDNFPSVSPDSPTAGFDTSAFFVGVRNVTEISSHVRTAGSFGTTCSIAGDAASTDLVCYVDVPEGDLYHSGIDLVYGSPAGMCRYLRRETYWYYNEEVGYGPSDLEINISLDADNNITASSCSADGVGPLACNSTNFPDLRFEIGDGDIVPSCVYNRTDQERENCCLGDYLLTKSVTTTPPGTTETSEISGKWYESQDGLKSCLGGGARLNWDVFDRDGFPRPLDTFAENGVSGVYEIVAPTESPSNARNSASANFYTTTVKHTHADMDPLTTTTSNLPYFIDPIDDRNGSLIEPGNDAYTFSCMDSAYETLHRIRVYIREWDTYADYLAYIASSGVTSVPDRTGNEGVGCTEGIFGPCNDALDLDNFVEGLPGGVYYSTPANRAGNFPYDQYD